MKARSQIRILIDLNARWSGKIERASRGRMRRAVVLRLVGHPLMVAGSASTAKAEVSLRWGLVEASTRARGRWLWADSA